MKKTVLWLSLSSVLFSGVATADTLLGLYLGADGWRTSTTGSFADTEQLQDFNFADKTQSSFYLAFEHPVPLVPNIRIQRNELTSSGATQLDVNFSFAGEQFAQGSQINNHIDLTSTDYVLYYEVLDNDLISIDLGVSAKHLDGTVAINDQGASDVMATEDISTLVPMLYSSVHIGLPLTGLDLFAQGSFVSYDGSRLYDMQAGIAYTLIDNIAVDLRLKTGYRAVNLQLENIDDVYADLDFSGVFAGIELHF